MSSRDVSPALRSILLITARGLRCALPLEHVIETMRPLPIVPMANAPAYVLGVSIIRGVPLPVVDLGALVTHGAAAVGATTPPTRVVTLRLGARQVALAVDAVVGIRSVEAGAIHELPPLLGGAGVVQSLGALDRQLLSVFDASRVLPEEVWTQTLDRT